VLHSKHSVTLQVLPTVSQSRVPCWGAATVESPADMKYATVLFCDGWSIASARHRCKKQPHFSSGCYRKEGDTGLLSLSSLSP